MTRIVTAGSILVFASAMVAAQSAPQAATPDQPQQTSKNYMLILPAPTCPVSLHALQGSGSGLLAVRNAKPVDGPVQRIHLILGGPAASRVVGAKVLVRGLSGKSEVVPAKGATDVRSDLTKTLDIRFASDADGNVAATLVLPGFTSVSFIQLDSIDYADGTTWRVAGERACHVTPDPMMLVTER